jgi:hypothetical protein
LSETTNGHADSVVMNLAWQLPKFLEVQLPMKKVVWRATVPRADSSSSQGRFQTLLTAWTIWVHVSASRLQALLASLPSLISVVRRSLRI